MKTRIILSALLLSCALLFQSCEGKEKIVGIDDLPETAREFINRHFPGNTVSTIIYDNEVFDKSYDVYFTDGSRIEFDKNGKWTDIDCHASRVPDSVVPTSILTYISTNMAERHIIGIDRDSNDYEVELDNHTDLKFDLNGNFIGID